MANNGIRFNINIPPEDIARLQSALYQIPDGMAKASSMALNKTIAGIRSDVKKEVAKAYTIKSNKILETITLKTATTSDLTAYLKSKGTVIPLTDFKYNANYTLSDTKHLVYLQRQDMYRWIKQRMWRINSEIIKGRTNRFTNVFMANMRGKLHIGINRGSHIQPMWGPSIPTMIEQQRVMPQINTKANERLSVEINRAIDKLIAEYNR